MLRTSLAVDWRPLKRMASISSSVLGFLSNFGAGSPSYKHQQRPSFGHRIWLNNSVDDNDGECWQVLQRRKSGKRSGVGWWRTLGAQKALHVSHDRNSS